MIYFSFLFIFQIYFSIEVIIMKNKKEILKLILKLNLILGIYNLYLYSQESLLFNLIVGSLNIGVWVFFRDLRILTFK